VLLTGAVRLRLQIRRCAEYTCETPPRMGGVRAGMTGNADGLLPCPPNHARHTARTRLKHNDLVIR
jgi:hypothetical protein